MRGKEGNQEKPKTNSKLEIDFHCNVFPFISVTICKGQGQSPNQGEPDYFMNWLCTEMSHDNCAQQAQREVCASDGATYSNV